MKKGDLLIKEFLNIRENTESSEYRRTAHNSAQPSLHGLPRIFFRRPSNRNRDLGRRRKGMGWGKRG